MSNKVEIKWLAEPEEHDYPAALSYLSPIHDEQKAATYVNRLKKAPISESKAEDVFRASNIESIFHFH
jgi:hypothetical protein